MAKPKLEVGRIIAASVSGEPLLYDSGVKYDDPLAYYDRWYPGNVTSDQGEIPTIGSSVEGIRAPAGIERTKKESVNEKVGAGAMVPTVTIDTEGVF